MRELVTREYVPTLAYAASVLFLAHLIVAMFLREGVAATGIHLLFVPVLVLLVIGVESPPWARLAGYAWAGLALLADLLLLGAATLGGNGAGASALGALALLPGAAWIYGASMADPGAGHALGAAAAAGLAFSALMGLVSRLILVGPWDLGAIVQLLALVVAAIWFAVLARDLKAGKRHAGGPVRVHSQ